MKRYCKNEKPFVYAVFSEHDAEQAEAVLQTIEMDGVLFWHAERWSRAEARRIEAAYSFVVFLSESAVRDENVLRFIELAVKHNKKILCVYLERTSLGSGLELLLNSLQSIDRSAFPGEEAFLGKLKSAAVFSGMQITPAQRRFAKRRALASVLVPIAAAVVAFFAVVVPLLIVPAVKAASGTLGRLGFGELSLAELAEVEELYVAGTQSYDQSHFVYYTTEDKSEICIDDLNEFYPTGDISDISDLTLLKNLKRLTFAGNQITDITPLFELSSLEVLWLYCNPIRSLEGIEALQNLESIDVSNTEISDITPLLEIPSLYSIDISNTYVSSIDGIENLPHLIDLRISGTNVSDVSALKKLDYSFSNWSGGFTLFVGSSYIRDYSALQSIPSFKELAIISRRSDLYLPYLEGKSVQRLILEESDIRSVDELRGIQDLEELELSYSSQLVSLDGLEVHSKLTGIRLTECTGVEDYSVLLELPYLKLLCISANLEERVMAQLADAKFEIFVEAPPEDMQNEE